MSRLVREIYLMEMLDHENIVKLYETIETCDSLFLVMEYIPGVNLDEYLHRQGGKLKEDEARHYFRQMVSAVYFCHNRWVVHRDLKTPNVLITPDGVVKLADFGLGNRFGLQRLKTICGKVPTFYHAYTWYLLLLHFRIHALLQSRNYHWTKVLWTGG